MRYGLIGEHLGHSFSKVIHEKIGDYVYEIKEIEPENVAPFMKARDFNAINVTIPYKEKVIPMLDFVDESAKKIGAVNTVVNRDGKLYGYNTDYSGMRALVLRVGAQIEGSKVLIIGTGGTSKTARAVVGDMGDLGEKMYTVMLKSGPEILNLLFDNTMLSSASDLLGGAEDGEELGANIVKTVAGSTLQQMLSPADIRQFAKFTDEYERDYRDDNPVIEAINKNVIRYWPVLRQTLPIKYDMTGDPGRYR